MSQRNVDEDELLDKLWTLVEKWRGGPGPRASDIAVTKRNCANELEALLKEV